MSDDVSNPRRPVNRRAYRAAVVAFTIAFAGGIAAAVGYWTDETGDLLGLGLAAALIGIGFGLVAWAKYLDLDFGEGLRMLVHLSQAGRMDFEEPPKRTKPKGSVVRLRFSGGRAVLVREHGTERKAGWWVAR